MQKETKGRVVIAVVVASLGLLSVQRSVCQTYNEQTPSVASAPKSITETIASKGDGSPPTSQVVTEYYQFGTNTLTSKNSYVSINSGAYLLNPYKLVNTNQIAPGDSKAVFGLDLAVNYMLAWNPERRQKFIYNHFQEGKTFNGWRGRDWGFPVYDDLDFQSKVSFFINGESSDRSASAIVGAGDFAADITIGYPLLFGVFTDLPGTNLIGAGLTNLYLHTTSVHWFGLVASYGATTDKNAFDVHNRYFAGFGYRAAFPAAHNREALVSVHIGCAWVESTRFVDSTTRTIFMKHDAPKYFLESGLGIETECRIPLTDAADITFGARIYSGHEPGKWSANIGLTYPLEKLLGFFK